MAAITFAELDPRDVLCLISAWRPGDPADRWRSWAEFLRDFTALRPELVARFGDRLGGRPLFGDRVSAYLARHGAAALERASYEQLRGEA